MPQPLVHLNDGAYVISSVVTVPVMSSVPSPLLIPILLVTESGRLEA